VVALAMSQIFNCFAEDAIEVNLIVVIAKSTIKK